MASNGSFYQNGLPLSTLETGLGNVSPGAPVANKASSSFYLSGSSYTQANPTLAAASATAAAASATAAAASAASVPALLSTYAPLASPALTGAPTGPTATLGTNTTQLATTAFVLANAGTGGASPASVAPLMDGSAAVGTSLLYARQDHVHPSDTSRAPIASPTLTGTPTAPTAAALNNSTQLATTAYADAAVSTLSTAVATSLGLKAPLASPALTGTPTGPTATVGTNTTQLATTAFVLANVPAGVTSFKARTGAVVPVAGDYLYSDNTAALPRSWVAGFPTNNNVTTPHTVIDIGTGTARDSTNAVNITLTSALSKSVASTWVVGSGNGGLDTGTVAASTWYYMFAIYRNDTFVVDVLFSLSPTAPTLPTSYTHFRRIGSFKMDASTFILGYIQVNDQWWWASSPRDVSTGATLGTTQTLFTLSVPRVLGVTAKLAVTFFNASVVTMYIVPGFLGGSAINGGALNISSTGGGTQQMETMVNSSAQIYGSASLASSTLVIDTAGWRDPL